MSKLRRSASSDVLKGTSRFSEIVTGQIDVLNATMFWSLMPTELGLGLLGCWLQYFVNKFLLLRSAFLEIRVIIALCLPISPVYHLTHTSSHRLSPLCHLTCISPVYHHTCISPGVSPHPYITSPFITAISPHPYITCVSPSVLPHSYITSSFITAISPHLYMTCLSPYLYITWCITSPIYHLWITLLTDWSESGVTLRSPLYFDDWCSQTQCSRAPSSSR